jgi:hypothetical protein
VDDRVGRWGVGWGPGVDGGVGWGPGSSGLNMCDMVGPPGCDRVVRLGVYNRGYIVTGFPFSDRFLRCLKRGCLVVG